MKLQEAPKAQSPESVHDQAVCNLFMGLATHASSASAISQEDKWWVVLGVRGLSKFKMATGDEDFHCDLLTLGRPAYEVRNLICQGGSVEHPDPSDQASLFVCHLPGFH